MIKVMIVENWPVIRTGLAVLINKTGENTMSVCADMANIGNITDIKAKIKENRPDLLIIDPLQSQTGGESVIESIAKKFKKLRILIFSTVNKTIWIHTVIQAGGHGYVDKTDSDEDILKAICEVAEGGNYLSDRAHNEVIGAAISHTNTSKRRYTHTINDLAEKETEVFELLGKGYSNVQIAEKYGTSKKTVAAQIEKIKTKLGIKTRAQAVRYSIEWLFIAPKLK